MMLYCCNKMSNRIILFCFGIAFFVFLIGRDGLEQLFNYEQKTIFSQEINNHAYTVMILALIGIWSCFMIFNNNNPAKYIQNIEGNRYYYYVRKYSALCFYLTYPFAIGLNIGIAFFVFKYGYYSLYTDFSGLIEASPLLYLVNKIEITMPAAFSIFMATLPSKKEFKKLAYPYLLYLILTLFSGQRGNFVIGILLLIIFLAYMQQLQPSVIWIKKIYIKSLIICLPFLAIGASLYNTIRFDRNMQEFNPIESFTDFFYSQGVTSNLIKRAYQFEENIPKQKDFYTLEFLHTGIPARLLGNKVYQGNTIDHATKGGSFVYAVGYTIMGDAYLAGGGPGSSFIAELYYDFGYLGVIIGGCLYGYLFTIINNFKSSSLFKRSLIFIVITQLLWAVRASFSGFLSFIFAPTTIILLLFVFLCAKVSIQTKTIKSVS